MGRCKCEVGRLIYIVDEIQAENKDGLHNRLTHRIKAIRIIVKTDYYIILMDTLQLIHL